MKTKILDYLANSAIPKSTAEIAEGIGKDRRDVAAEVAKLKETGAVRFSMDRAKGVPLWAVGKNNAVDDLLAKLRPILEAGMSMENAKQAMSDEDFVRFWADMEISQNQKGVSKSIIKKFLEWQGK